MRRIGKAAAVLTALAAMAGMAFHAAAEDWPPAGPAAWSTIDGAITNDANEAPWVQPLIYQGVIVNMETMRNVLAGAPMEDSPDAATDPLLISLPRPDGTLAVFSLVESPVMHPDLAAQFPDIKTYSGQGVDEPEASVRLDITPLGFHAQVLAPGGAWYMDPYFKDNTLVYTSHYKRDLVNTHGFACLVPDAQEMVRREMGGNSTRAVVTRKQYRLANACTGEYAAKFGGTVAGAQAAIVTAVNRVTGVYENEVAVRLVLVANNTNVVYTNSATDPYTNNDGGAMLGQNVTACNAQIGSANYDIGHVFSTGGGGVAGLGVVCGGSKAWGVTGLGNPTGDAFYIDYVAHEMGHQFGANHNFNGTGGSCNGNRNASTAYEIGSGTTIMGYAGICSADDIQAHSDPYFGFGSITEISNFINAGGGNNCDAPTNTGNNTPVCSAGAAITVPQQTPFYLTPVSASDPDGDPITYSWEERDLGAAQAALTADNGTSPLFRPFSPKTDNTRLVPQLTNILSGTLTKGEKWAQTNRSVKWRLTVRDNKAGGGGTGISDRTITVTTTSGPFSVTTANSATTWPGGSTQAVAWAVANTTAAPVNCTNVNILFSSDNGATFPTVLVANTPNDGSENIIVPGSATVNGRIKIEAVGNIFFDINNAKITVQATTPPPDPTGVSATPNPVCAGSNTSLSATVGAGIVVDWYNTGCGSGFIGTGNPLVVAPTGTTTYFAKARRTSDGIVSTGCGSVLVTVNPLPTAPTGASIDSPSYCEGTVSTIELSATGGSGSTLRWYSGSCGGTLVGTGTPLVISAPSSTTTYFARWENSCGFSTCASATATVNPAPTAPTGASVDHTGFCPVDVPDITLTASGGSGDTLNWYSGSCGGTLVGSGSPLTIPSPSASTTYYARWENACGPSSCVSVDVDIITADFDGSGFVDIEDYSAFVVAFEAGDESADFDGSGFVDIEDFTSFVQTFEAGC